MPESIFAVFRDPISKSAEDILQQLKNYPYMASSDGAADSVDWFKETQAIFLFVEKLGIISVVLLQSS